MTDKEQEERQGRILNRVRIAYERVLGVYEDTTNKKQKRYIKAELAAMKKSRDIILNAFDASGDGRYAIVAKIDDEMAKLALDYEDIDSKGAINGYAMALALYHDNEQPL